MEAHQITVDDFNENTVDDFKISIKFPMKSFLSVTFGYIILY